MLESFDADKIHLSESYVETQTLRASNCSQNLCEGCGKFLDSNGENFTQQNALTL